MKGKYINESWYIVFDGTSFYGVLGMDIEDTLNEDSDIEVVSGPYKEYPEEKIEQLKKKRMENKFLDFANDLYDVLAMNTELCTQEVFFNQYVKEDKSFMLNLGRDKSYIYFDDFKITIEKR